jgi:hypothetical protein
MRRSNYRVLNEQHETILIDSGPHDKYLTITNDAENIINELTPEQKSKPIIYIDTDNEVVQLILNDDLTFKTYKVYNQHGL